MNFLIDIGLFMLALILSALWFSVTALPIFYGIPRSIAWIVKGKVRASACLFYLRAPIFWMVVFTFAAFVLMRFFPQTFLYLNDSAPFFTGQLVGTVGSLFYAFSKSGRQSLNVDFLAAMESFKI